MVRTPVLVAGVDAVAARIPTGVGGGAVALILARLISVMETLGICSRTVGNLRLRTKPPTASGDEVAAVAFVAGTLR